MRNYYIFSLLILFVTGCSNQGSSQEEPTDSATAKTEQRPSVGLNAISQDLLSTYFEIKDALVDTDSIKAAENARVIITESEKMAEMEELMGLAEKLSQSTNIETQRKYFSEMSQTLYTMVKQSGKSDITIYKQYCPMAFNNEGGFWLSDSDEILNPYFGDKMLKCGKVEEEILPI